MSFRWNLREQLTLGAYALRWFCIAAPIAAVIGSACALFLWSLDVATHARFTHPWLLFLLPLAGAGISAIYLYFGREAEGGNDLLMEEIHEPGAGIPRRMAPLILFVTIVTHLFGGSAGREGTAVQMGGSIASSLGRWFKLKPADMRMLMMAGIAAGFGGVFGTPLTGAVFAMEVLAVGRMSYEAIIPCLIGSVIGDWSCTAWGIRHEHIAIAAALNNGVSGGMRLDWWLAGKVAVAAVAFGLVSMLFAELVHGVKNSCQRFIAQPLLRPVVGACGVIALVYIVGSRDYIGLGVYSDHAGAVTIQSCFTAGGADPFSWWWKLLFTAVTLGSGFKGGEVTPLFFIGAALGNVLAGILHAPVDLFAGLGFVAVFAGATNTPLACTIMGIELFGSDHVVYFMIACFLAYLFSGHSGIYMSQRIGIAKADAFDIPPDVMLSEARELSYRKRRKSGIRQMFKRPDTQETPPQDGGTPAGSEPRSVATERQMTAESEAVDEPVSGH